MIQRVYIENFKAISRAADLPLQPFTAFIGNNGSGKSSIIEALKLLQDAVVLGLEPAINTWGDLKNIRNYNANLEESAITNKGFKKNYEPIIISLTALVNGKKFEYQVRINNNISNDFYVVEHEELLCQDKVIFVSDAVSQKGDAAAYINSNYFTTDEPFVYKADSLLLAYKGSPTLSSEIEEFYDYVESWQFLYLNAHTMGNPIVQSRSARDVRLDYDGRNIAEYILWIRSQGQEYLDSIIRKMTFVLPYLSNIQPNVNDAFHKEVELLMHEKNEKSRPLPGWLMSSGTLRILALLSVFDTPKPPSVLFVDEIENGLDPRTIGLILNEIRNETTEGKMQVVVTTHSPYMLDLLPIESLIVTDKKIDSCVYHIPHTEERLKVWIDKFTPGRLFSTGKFSR